ncbi:MAG: hypothetical protein ACKOTZ_12775 [Chloroflexota bacterium]
MPALRTRRSALAALVAAVALALPAAPTAAAGAQAYAWAVVRDVAAEFQTLGPAAAMNAYGVVEVDTDGPGIFEVRFVGMGAPILDAGGNRGVALVSALSRTAAACRLTTWRPEGTDVVVDVACTRRDGTPASVPFVVSYTFIQDGTVLPAERRAADAWADRPASDGAVSTTWRYSPSGLDITSERLAVGAYRLFLPSTSGDGGTMLVSKWGGAGACAVAQWYTTSGGGHADVACRDLTGQDQDTQFAFLRIVGPGGLMPYASPPSAYALANRPTAPRYRPAALTRFNSSGKRTTIVRSARGTYQVTFAGQPGGGGAQVSARSSDGHRCNLTAIARKAPARVGVRCFTRLGAPADVAFTVVWTK